MNRLTIKSWWWALLALYVYALYRFDGSEAAIGGPTNCNVCLDGRFACVNTTYYGFCYGTTAPNISTVTACPPGYVCTLNVPCDNAIVAEPSCSVPVIEPDAFCQAQGRQGYYKFPNDATCKKYIYCFLLSGQFLGAQYNCIGYFNDAIGLCQTDRPVDC